MIVNKISPGSPGMFECYEGTGSHVDCLIKHLASSHTMEFRVSVTGPYPL